MIPPCFHVSFLYVRPLSTFSENICDTADKSQPWETMMVALAAPRSEVGQNLLLKGMELSGLARTRLEVFQA